jgi:nicotinate-nucleotide adenylyltransferase
MLQLALRGMPNVEISTIEVDRPPPSYTIDTLKSLVGPSATDRPVAFLLIGADQALDFHRWKDWQGILELVTPAVMLRPPWTPERFEAALRDRYEGAEANRWLGWTLQTLPMLDVTATDIRSRLAGGRSVSGLLDPRVEAFIRDHELYGTGRAAP